jgi:hypothetical protein
MNISSDFRELLTLLNDAEVKYLVVGGYALAAHGFPRNTKDIDIFYEATPDNATNLMSALKRFGFGDVGLSKVDFLQVGQIVQLGYPPNRVDLINSISGVTFEEAWPDRVTVVIENVAVPVISPKDFVRNKKAAGRLTDLADAERLGEENQPPEE